MLVVTIALKWLQVYSSQDLFDALDKLDFIQ